MPVKLLKQLGGIAITAAGLHVNRERLGLCEPECVKRDNADCTHVVQEGGGGQVMGMVATAVCRRNPREL